MSSFLKNTIFYVVIAGDDSSDHLFLRKAMNKLLPQAIVESLYEIKETITFFEKHSPVPNLIFIDMGMITRGGCEILKLIGEASGLKQVPVIVLADANNHFNKNDLSRFGANEFYSKPYHFKTIDQIVNDLREKWFNSLLGQKKSS